MAGTERIPLGVEPTGDDITFDRTGDPQFTDAFREDVRDARIRDAEARFQATNPGGSMPQTGEEQEPSPSLSTRAENVFEATQEQGLGRAVERGGALSEAARDVTATGLGVAFQNPEEVAPTFGISEARAREEDIAVSGPGVTAFGEDTGGTTFFDFEQGERGELNQAVVDD
ncbi:MAG: hypothetical protein R6U42_00845, partial [Halomonas sp.]